MLFRKEAAEEGGEEIHISGSGAGEGDAQAVEQNAGPAQRVFADETATENDSARGIRCRLRVLRVFGYGGQHL